MDSPGHFPSRRYRSLPPTQSRRRPGPQAGAETSPVSLPPSGVAVDDHLPANAPGWSSGGKGPGRPEPGDFVVSSPYFGLNSHLVWYGPVFSQGRSDLRMRRSPIMLRLRWMVPPLLDPRLCMVTTTSTTRRRIPRGKLKIPLVRASSELVVDRCLNETPVARARKAMAIHGTDFIPGVRPGPPSKLNYLNKIN